METVSTPHYWNKRYTDNQTGWDIGYASTPLVAYFEQLTEKTAPILIPGCGNGYEAAWLLEHGFTSIAMLDIAEEPVQKLRKQFAGNPCIQILQEDFFEHRGAYSLIIEQTFFCAIDPARRLEYVHKMHELLLPGGKLAGVLFNRSFEGGPPFGGYEAEYRPLFESRFSIRTMQPCYNSITPRAGTELFIIAVKPAA
jgi:methyl halide transferase